MVGPQQFYQGVDEQEQQLLSTILNVLRDGPVLSASIRDAEQADAILVLGPDLLNEAPRLALAFCSTSANSRWSEWMN
ncbi:MAG: hypothetical protein IPP12_00165 [Nitrospira sp.]|nr:hypothetical protein [Nitrospira sp.]